MLDPDTGDTPILRSIQKTFQDLGKAGVSLELREFCDKAAQGLVDKFYILPEDARTASYVLETNLGPDGAGVDAAAKEILERLAVTVS